MYEVIACPPGQVAHGALVVHMRENRSTLTNEARWAFATLALVLMILSIAPVVYGYWLVPAFSLFAVTGLTFALEWHQKREASSETLEIAPRRVRHADSEGHVIEAGGPWLAFALETPTPTIARLVLRTAHGAVEIGRCLSLDERRALAPVIASALAGKAMRP